MKIQAIIHEAEEGGYWAEVPLFNGCYTQGETIDETIENLKEVVQLYFDDDLKPEHPTDKVIEFSL
jgi:predicted RNase H-like HicB family nuclease